MRTADSYLVSAPYGALCEPVYLAHRSAIYRACTLSNFALPPDITVQARCVTCILDVLARFVQHFVPRTPRRSVAVNTQRLPAGYG